MLAQRTPTGGSLEDALWAAVELSGEGKYFAAANVLSPAVRAAEGAAPGPRLAVALTCLAGFYLAQWRFSESEQTYRRAVRLWENVGDPDVPWHTEAVLGLATAYLQRGRFALSEKLLEGYLPIWRERRAESPEVARLLHALGEAHENQRKYAEAAAFYGESLDILSNQKGQDEYQADLLLSLGRMHLKMQHYVEAHVSLERCLAIHGQLYARAHPTTVRPLLAMSTLHHATGEPLEAERWLKTTLETAFGTVGLEHPLVGTVLQEHATLLRVLGRKTDAKKVEKQARAILEKAPREGTSLYTVDVTELLAEQRRR